MTALAKRGGDGGGLLKVEEARELLAECKRVDEAKSIRDKAQAIKAYLRQQNASREAQNDAAEIKLRAERRLGELLKEQKKAGERANQGTPHKKLQRETSLVPAPPPKLKEILGTDTDSAARQMAKRFQDVASVPEEKFEAYVSAQRETEGGEITTVGLFKKATHVSQNTGQVEWYTPPEYLDAAREVMGSIDLDPATSEVAQRNVRAGTYFTVKDDGLAETWLGNVWMNPPYAAGLVDRFVQKLCLHVEQGQVEQAVVLVNNATDTAWFQLAAKHATAMCFPAGRVKFLNEQNEPVGAPLQGQAILYFGSGAEKFLSVFGRFGFCLARVAR